MYPPSWDYLIRAADPSCTIEKMGGKALVGRRREARTPITDRLRGPEVRYHVTDDGSCGCPAPSTWARMSDIRPAYLVGR